METYSYDAAGNLSSRTDFNGKTTTYTYDALNRLKTKVPDASFAAPTVTFTYNSEGLRTQMADASGATSYSYDTRHRMTSKTTPQGSLSYTYDAGSNLLSTFTGSGGGMTVSYTYDALNRLSTVSNAQTGTTSYTYDANGNLAAVTQPNGVAHSYTYNARNQLTNLGVNKGATPLGSYAYTLAPTGHRTQVAELSGRTVSYTYDNIYRLTSETIAGDTGATPQNGAIGYTYDAVGNRTQMTSNVPAVPAGLFFYDANDRLASDPYDNNGNTVSSGGIPATYDFENHLISKGGVSIVYNGDGQRVQKTAGSTLTKYLVDELNPTGFAQVILETTSALNGTNALSRQYVYGLDLISQRRQLTYTYDALNRLKTKVPDASFGAPTVTFTYNSEGLRTQMADASGTTSYSYDTRHRMTSKTTPQGSLSYTYDANGNLSTVTQPNQVAHS